MFFFPVSFLEEYFQYEVDFTSFYQLLIYVVN